MLLTQAGQLKLFIFILDEGSDVESGEPAEGTLAPPATPVSPSLQSFVFTPYLAS